MMQKEPTEGGPHERKKLSHVGSKVQITTLRMLGYRLELFED